MTTLLLLLLLRPLLRLAVDHMLLLPLLRLAVDHLLPRPLLRMAVDHMLLWPLLRLTVDHLLPVTALPPPPLLRAVATMQKVLLKAMQKTAMILSFCLTKTILKAQQEGRPPRSILC